ncbi:hypothetical protein ABH944_000699 [Caballeronia udeis]|uniref:Uncharacterized protein n=1 Tax=Caballeronia udeis TaxID=1232866 RepID=A0ABW8MB79_9BURK
MSRPSLRDLFRLVHSGLEKVALACAAFGLMHATARAGESASADVPPGEQWGSRAAPQLAADDPWSNPAAPTLALDDAWSAPAADRFTSSGQIHAALPASPASPASASTQQPRPAATESAPRSVATTVQEAPSALAMDRSDWNETPRGRSPGLIASHDAWFKRTSPVAKPGEPAKAPVSAPVQPTDPWSAPLTGLVASNNVVTPAPVASSAAFSVGSHWSFVVTPHVRLLRVSEAPGALRAEASSTVLAAGRPMHRRTRAIVHSSSNSSRSSGRRRASATRAPTPAWCRSVSACARHR